MIHRLLRPRQHQRRRRFRDRVLAAMLATSVVPLVAFAVVVAADLGSVTHGIVDETRRSILQGQDDRLSGQVGLLAGGIDTRLEALDKESQQLGRDAQAMFTTVAATPGCAAAGAAGHLQRYGPGQGMLVSGTGTSADDDSIVAAAAACPGGATAALGRLESVSTRLLHEMQVLRSREPAVDSVWMLDSDAYALRAVPGFDVNAALDERRLPGSLPTGSDGVVVYAADAARVVAPVDTPESWTDPARPPTTPSSGPLWSDVYPLRTPGDEAVSVLVPFAAPDGHRIVVGIDVRVNALLAGALPGAIEGYRGAYPILFSSTNRLLQAPAAEAAALAKDFPRLPAAGEPLASTPAGLHDGLMEVEHTGNTRIIPATLGGVDKEVFTATVPHAHWVLGTVVPASDLTPDDAALNRGVGSGVRSILKQVIPLALLLCLLAVLLANLLARRLVGPVRALTRAAERLAAGHMDEAVPGQGRDEVGLLATTLERMRREVDTSRDALLAASRELEGRVAERTAELRARNEELVALNALAESLTSSLEPRTILEGALDAVRVLLPVRAAAGFLLGDGGVIPLAAVTNGPVPAGVPSLETVAAGAVDEGVMVHRVVDGALVVGLPLETSEGRLGALALVSLQETALEEPTHSLLGAVADQVALALRTAQLSAEGRELAVLEERTRLAREIHDTLAQQLTAIVLQLEAAEAFVDRDHDRTRAVVVAAREAARTALAEARRSVWNLRPAPLDATGLVAALQIELRRWRERTGIAGRLHSGGLTTPLALQPQAEVALFRIVQEALANVARHSGARRVDVRVEQDGGELRLSVRDDGCGFDPASRSAGESFGLLGMAERARLVGAAVEVHSAVGAGTVVAVRLPLADAPAVSVPA